ncbi:FABP family protein [Phenylobacterium sp.]|uniref:FABP family protein n=1 Tax=Phenylobacterium sp. TaxID=1871053 RepID=UPI0035ADD398
MIAPGVTVNPFPDDIFTEPENVDPNGLANLGPLRRLAGVWEGRKGLDVNPKADGPERREYIERIEMTPIDPQANGPQLFYGLRYHVRIIAVGEETTFHDQVGYWLWEPATGLVMQSLAIPRGQTALAGGKATETGLKVSARRGETEYGISSTAFLEHAFRTESYTLEITFHDDGSWSYISDTMLAVLGQEGLFQHRDHNTLTKVAEPQGNPLMRRQDGLDL